MTSGPLLPAGRGAFSVLQRTPPNAPLPALCHSARCDGHIGGWPEGTNS